ncbi:hypothetical protein C8R46DRAFT_1364775 [Mycena filopes]|nr:hypothetical protein C8R46DRAFT_1364775 [Mycena filopes]
MQMPQNAWAPRTAGASTASSNPTAQPGTRIPSSVLYAVDFPPLKKVVAASPAVHRVPPEVICEVFALTMPYGTQRLGRHETERPPWQLGHICRLWRDTALAYPPLWSTISLIASGEMPNDGLCPPEMVETLLRRSGNSSLTVSIFWNTSTSSSSKSLHQLLRHSHRWKTARVRDLPVELLGRVKGKLQCLDTLELPHPHPETHDIFALTPNLRKVFLADANYRTTRPLFDSKVQLPWSQLTHFRGCYASAEPALKLLEAAPNLIEVGLGVLGQEPTAPFDVALPQLQRLTIVSIGPLMTSVLAPALQQVWIAGRVITSLHDCIRRSSCQLSKLVVYDVGNPSSLIPLLQAVPTLRTLFITLTATSMSASEFHSALKVVTDNRSRATICPNLSHIAVGVSSPGFKLDTFLDMVESRWYTERPSRLAFVRVFYRRRGEAFDREANLRIGAMIAEGLNIDLDMEPNQFPPEYVNVGRP